MLHDVMETVLTNAVPPVHPLADGTPDQVNAVYDALEYLDKLKDKLTFAGNPVITQLVEKKVYLDKIGIADVYGTADVILLAGNEIHVVDWKFGFYPVYAEGNLQLKAYGLGAALCFHDGEGLYGDIEKVVVHIVQPRLDLYTVAEYDRLDLPEIAEEIKSITTAANAEDPKFNPGEDQCKWCKYKTFCTARFDATDSLAREAFSAYTEGRPVLMDDKADLLTRCGFLKKYLADIEGELTEFILTGGEVSGVKVVEGRKSRGWKHEENARWALRNDFGHKEDELYEKKFLTAPKAEKLNKTYKKDPAFQELIEVKRGKPTLVPASDRRADYQVKQNAADAFSGHLE